MNILLTGATGNIGKAIIDHHSILSQRHEIFAGARNVEKAQKRTAENTHVKWVEFDFSIPETFTVFDDIDLLFLLRPPQISDVKKVFHPLLDEAKKRGVQRIVFLSVQGAEKSSIIPHHKIEKAIKERNFDYVFLRPGYFMQNITTTLYPEIKEERTITLPSGNGKFNWVDVNDIGEVAAITMSDFNVYKNNAFELTGSENLNFYEVTEIMQNEFDLDISFKSINPFSFYFKKKKLGVEKGFALVMTILHFLPRIQKEPKISNSIKEITGHPPQTIKDFVKRNQTKLKKNTG